jgi:acetolactate synthase I/II/III large subunit
MSLHSLVSAVELGVNLTVVVLDNNILGWVYNGQRGRVIASELESVDYAAVASAIGAFARSVDTLHEARAAIRDTRRRSGVSVVVAKTTKADRYQDIMSALNPHDVYAVPEQ